jgi:hypothetical protein
MSVSLFFLPPVLVMGNLYKRKAAARSVLTAGIITILAESLMSLVIGYALGFDPVAKFKQFMMESIASMPPGIRDILPKDQDWYVNFIVQVIPLYLIFGDLFYTFVSHGISSGLVCQFHRASDSFIFNFRSLILHVCVPRH